MIQWSHAILFVAATLGAQHVAAQTKAEIQAEGVELGKAVQATAGGIVKDSASPETIVPGYAGTTLPEASLFDDAGALAAQGAALKSGSEAYSVATTPNAASIDPATLDVALGTAIEQDPEAFLEGTDIDGVKNGCVPIPQEGAGEIEYVASCNTGVKIEESNPVCSVPLIVSVEGGTSKYQYKCDDSFHHSKNNSKQLCGRLDPYVQAGQCTVVEDGIITGSICHQYVGWGQCVEPDVMFGKRILCSELVLSDMHYSVVGGSTVTETWDEASCNAATENKSCAMTGQTCSDSTPQTRIIGGVAVTKPCWGWDRAYSCVGKVPASDCTDLDGDAACTFAKEECLDDEDDPDPACQVKERTYSCKKAGGPGGQPAYLCGGDLYCIDGECTQVEREASTEFKDAMVAVHTLGDVRDQFDADTLTIFSGAKEGCHKPVFGLVNCCAGRVSGLLSAGVGFGAIASGPVAVAALATPFLSMFMCSNEEKLLDVKDRMGLCHRVGTYCSAKALFVCTTKRTNYCCYESKLARVLQEQGRNQLGKGWGTAKKAICDGFTIEEFQQLDLSMMDFVEVYDDFMEAAKVPDEIQTSLDIQEKIQAYYELQSN